MLESLGVTALAEVIYLALLDGPGASAADLAEATGIAESRVDAELLTLEELGLVTHKPTHPARFGATTPDLAIENLVRRQEERLRRVRMEAAGLAERFHAANRPSHSRELVEVLAGREASALHFAQLLDGAEREVMGFDTPPYVRVGAGDGDPRQLREGVTVRTIYSPEALVYPGKLQHIRRWRDEVGETARVFPELPMKIVVVDRAVALVPLTADPADGAVLVRRSLLLDAMVRLFEELWAKACPVDPDGLAEGTSTRALSGYLAAGLTDDAIARQMAVSGRTLRRRIAELMTGLDARTRFQAGYLYALRTRESTRKEG